VCSRCAWFRDCLPISVPHCERYNICHSVYIIISHQTVFVIPDLPAPQNVEIMMDIEQNNVSLSWDYQILSETFSLLTYRLYYNIIGGCAVTNCKKSECRIERKRFNPNTNSYSSFFWMIISPYTNYTWRLELTYYRDQSKVSTETIANIQTSQSG